MSSGSTEDRGTRGPRLAGLRVLVVEDRGLIAAKIAQVLRQAGCDVVGPAGTVRAGLNLAECEGSSLDAALLDLDLRGERVYALAKLLQTNEVPFLFLTGYGAAAMPEAWRGAPRLEKPVDPASLREAVQRLVAGKPEPARDEGSFVGDPLPVVREAWETIRRQRDLIMEGQIRIHANHPQITKWKF